MDAVKAENLSEEIFSHATFDRKSKGIAHVKIFQDTFYEGKNLSSSNGT